MTNMNAMGNPGMCVAVLNAIAAVEGVEPRDLEFTLHDHVDTDAIEQLARDTGGRWELDFDVPGHQVTVRSDRTVIVDGEVVRGHD